MKYLIAIAALAVSTQFALSQNTGPNAKVGILYLADHPKSEAIGDSIRANYIGRHARIDDYPKINVHTRSYQIGSGVEKLKELIGKGAEYIVGPSDSGTLMEINNWAAEEGIDLPYFVCPTISMQPESFDYVDFMSISPTNQEKAQYTWDEIISQYGVEQIGLYYENNPWGLDVFSAFDNLPESRVLGKPFPEENQRMDSYPAMAKFIDDLAEKDMRIVVLAPWKNVQVRSFLHHLKRYNQQHFATYRPIIILFNDYNLGAIESRLTRKLTVYGITDLREPDRQAMSEELANTLDATYLLLQAISLNHPDAQKAKSAFENFQSRKNMELEGLNFDHFHTSRYASALKQYMNIYKVKLKADTLRKVAFAGFSDYQLIRGWQTKLAPFWRFQNFPRNPAILFVFILFTFISFTVFMHHEYYTPFKTLFELRSFWYWFVIYSSITILVISVFLYFGFIKSNQLIVIVTAGLGCPLIMNYIFKQLSNISIPLVTPQILDFIRRLKESVDMAFHRIIPDDSFDKIVEHIDKESTFYKVRMSVYNLILDMKSNALTKRFAQDLKEMMEGVDDMLTDQEENDEHMMEQLRKKRLIKFYVQILYFTSMNDNSFRLKLVGSGLGQEKKLRDLLYN